MTRAVIYARQSLDAAGDGLAVERQREACEGEARRRGWTVTATFTDNDRSATTGDRPQYRRMLAAIEAGSVDAVVVWHLDRLHRRPAELETFIDLADRKGVRLASVSGEVNLGTESGRLHARIMGAVARHEVEHKSARQRAANVQRRDRGLPPSGRRLFGYETDGMALRTDEAEQIRDAARRVIAGESLRSICRDFAERGVTTTAGGPWHPTELRRSLGNPRYAGVMTHRGEVLGKGKWPAILTDDEHAAVTATLAVNSTGTGRPRAHLLSGIAVCGVCGERLYASASPTGARYFCQSRRHLMRRADDVEGYVTALVLARLARADAAELFSASPDRERVRELVAEQSALRARLDALAAAFAAGDIDAQQMTTGSKPLRARIEAVGSALAALSSAPVMWDRSVAPEQAWERLSVEDRGRVVDVLMRVAVFPPGRGARVFDPSTVEIEWKS